MTELRQINGKLCRMVEPEPLTPEATFPCVVRLIQDDSPMGLYHKDLFRMDKDEYNPKICNEVRSLSDLSDSNRGSVIHSGGIISAQYYHFEIIGYPAAEGSAEWALYQMMQGKWVYNPSLEKHKSDKLDTRYLHAYGKFGQDIVVKNTLTGIDSILGAASISHWTNYAEPSGWQLYEPKPEPAKEQFEVGDWVTYNLVWGHIVEVRNYWVDVIDQDGIIHTISGATLRKIKPAEVEVDFGYGVRGRVYLPKGEWGIVVLNEHSDWIAQIDQDAIINKPLQSFIERLLKAQEEK